MKYTNPLLVLAVAAMVAFPSVAQESDAPSLSLGEEIGPDGQPVIGDGMGESYVDETFADWERVCVRTPEGDDPCQMYQMLSDENDGVVAEIHVFPLPPGQQAAAGATFLAPLETLLTAQLTLRIDGGSAKRYPFTFCSGMGCVARVGFTAEEVEQLKRGAGATWTLVPAFAPDQEVNARMSLMGFTAAFDSLEP